MSISRAKIFTENKVVDVAELVYLRSRAVPTALDGLYDDEANASSDNDGKIESHSRLFSIMEKVQEFAERGLPLTDPKFPVSLVDAVLNSKSVDDRKGFFVELLSILTKLPPGKVQDKLNDVVITALYKTLPHPPSSYLGPKPTFPCPAGVDPTPRSADPEEAKRQRKVAAIRSQYQYRQADGGLNNVDMPDLGRAGGSYARSVQGKHPQPANALPDSGLVFDTLLCAKNFQAHPGRNSSLTFAWASLVTHSLFRTDPMDWNKNNTSSYFDLSPLYGFNQEKQDQVRDKDQGRGLLYPDTFSEERLIFLPPAASALLVIFSRNHNYIANMLLKINERGKWNDPPPTDALLRAQQDEEIFQTARLINCGHFMAIIFGDYVAGFLGLGRDGNAWSMKPFDPITTDQGEVIERGRGNQVSVEFNMLYRWHATTAQHDIKWTEEAFGKLFKDAGINKQLKDVDLKDFSKVAQNTLTKIERDPRKRTFADLKRTGPNGMGAFDDDQLAKVLHDATENVAGAYRARGTPEALRVIEILGIEQARKWGVCTMNEFRQFLGLKAFSSFKEWNQTEAIWRAAEKLYGHVDNLELYVGLQGEDCMPLGPGSGICCGYTMTRAILADAIALVRGDRFYTVDYTPANLTAWGYQDCARNPDNGSFGAALPKLLFRNLPRHYPENSVYGCFPFFIPSETQKNLTTLGLADKYTFDRPVAKPVPLIVKTLQGIEHVLSNSKTYATPAEDKTDVKSLTDGYGFVTVFDEKAKRDADRSMIVHALVPDKDALEEHKTWFRTTVTRLIKEKTYTYDFVKGKHLDVVRDVINLVAVHWAADKIMGITLKTKETPYGTYTEQEFYDILTTLYTCAYENTEPEHAWPYLTTAATILRLVKIQLQQNIIDVNPRLSPSILQGLVAHASQIFPALGKTDANDFLTRLAESGRPLDALYASALGLGISSSVSHARAVANVVDFYFKREQDAARADLIKACKENDTKRIEGYVREGMRLHPGSSGVYREVTADDDIVQGSGLPTIHVRKGDVVFANFKEAQLNPTDFANPSQVDPGRSNNQIQSACFSVCPGVDFSTAIAVEIVKAIFSLPNIKSVAGNAGSLQSFTVNNNTMTIDKTLYVSKTTGAWTTWPSSLQVTYD